MGIKENFAQALKELAGGNKDEKAADKKAAQVENLRKAVENEDIVIPRGEFKPAPIEPKAEETPAVEIPMEPAPAETVEKNPEPEDTAKYYQPNVPPLMPYGAVFQSNTPTGLSEPEPSPLPMSQPRSMGQTQPVGQTQATYGNAAGQNRGSEQTPFPSPNMGNIGGSQLGVQAPPSPMRPAYSEEEITVISKNTVVDGNIRSFANMMIDGDIKGDIETTKNIDLNGKVIGNLICNNAEMHASQIQGNIRLKGNVVMERDTLLIGDLVSTYAKINGKIKGNLDISGKAEFKSDSVIFGDISASTITVGDGAIIQGYVSTTFLSKEESINIFPEAITIGE